MNNKEKADLYIAKVQQWIAERDLNQDFIEYERNGKVNRNSLCSELDFSRSVINQNVVVREILSQAEVKWYGVKEQDTQAHDAARERAEKRVAQTNSNISKLEDELAKLKAENAMLKKQLQKYAAMDAVIQQAGLAPRL